MERTSTGAGEQRASVDQTLEATVQRYSQALQRFDAKEFASYFADDATILSPFGSFAKGRAEIERVFSQDAPKIYEGAKLKVSIVGARRIGSDHVLLDLDVDVQNMRKPDGSRGPGKVHNTILAQKQGDRWQFVDARPYIVAERAQLH
jgi:uncharacterized protein (TIGR02246 family)